MAGDQAVDVRVILNAGFGSTIGVADLNLIRQLGFAGVRQDVPPGMEVPLIREFAPGGPGAGLRPLFLVNGGKMDEDPEPAGGRAAQVALMMHELGVDGEIEIGNEPDIARERYSRNPREHALSIRVAWDIMQRDRRLRGTRLVVGGVMNSDERGLRYLSAVLSGTPPGVIVGFHTYRQHTTPDKPSDGFSSRQAEFHRLQAIAGGRPLWCTETGRHTYPFKVGCWPFRRTKRWSDAQVLEHLELEARLNREAGVQVFTVFQMNDADVGHFEGYFGIRRVDGTLKPSSEIARRVA